MHKSIAIAVTALFFTLSIGLAQAEKDPPASFTKACKGTHCKGKARWAEKTDTAEPPLNPKPKSVSVADITGWNGPSLPIKTKGAGQKRVPAEEQWYSITGKVTLVRLEGDGDLHIQLEASPGSPKPKSGDATYVVVEVPANSSTKNKDIASAWCNYRTTVLGWTNFDVMRKPIVTSDRLLTMTEHPVITVTGKAFYDIDHAPADHAGNKRPTSPNVAVWEIHPVMDLKVVIQ